MPTEKSTRLCECGCGEFTYLTERAYHHLGLAKGDPRRFLKGHSAYMGSLAAALVRPPRKPRAQSSRCSTYNVWSNMKQRCLNPKFPQFADYGGRGITVCESWRKYANFLTDMGERPPGLTIERRDNDLGYSKSNCVWADRFQQAANTRKSVRLTLNGRTLHVLAWARELGVSPYTLFHRIKMGWSDVDVLTKSIRGRAISIPSRASVAPASD